MQRFRLGRTAEDWRLVSQSRQVWSMVAVRRRVDLSRFIRGLKLKIVCTDHLSTPYPLKMRVHSRRRA